MQSTVRFLGGWLWAFTMLMGHVWSQSPNDSLPPHAWQLELPAASVHAASPLPSPSSSAATVVARLGQTPGVRLANLGEGLVQPVLAGLQGSRVQLIERGMPMHGGRWGSDHGAVLPFQSLLSNDIQVAQGMDRLGFGALIIESVPWLPGRDTTRWEVALRGRMGDGLWGTEARWTQRRDDLQISVEAVQATFGDRNVPDSGFVYLGRTLPIRDGRLLNTSGRSQTGRAALRWRGRHSWEMAVSGGRVEQGLFPGFVGFPLEADLRGDDAPFLLSLPLAESSRLSLTLRSWRAGSGGRWRFGVQWNDRSEFAPPHAHGWGPLPDDALSFQLKEFGGFAGFDKNLAQGWQISAEAEWLNAQTAGWEFLLPDHQRLRLAAGLFHEGDVWTWGARFAFADHRAAAHQEPLYNAAGDSVGLDVRAEALHREFVGMTVHLERGLSTRGTLRVRGLSRLPDAYELSANGIHHGTARFEQGSRDLRPEHELEVAVDWSATRWAVRAWGAASPDFIFLTPTSAFAPIAHAGQVMAFEQAPAWRMGLEAHWQTQTARPESPWFMDVRGAALAAWRLDEGTGLPFTPPFDATITLGWRPIAWMQCTLAAQAIAPSLMLARNEVYTPGVLLVDAGVEAEGQVWQNPFTLRLQVRNAGNTAYFNHINPYRVLDLSEQGRTIELSLNTQF